MLRHYLLTALRNIWRHRVTTAINIVGLAIGLTFFIVAFAWLTMLENGDRDLENSGRIYFVAHTSSDGVGGRLTSSMSPTAPAAYLRADLPGLAAVSQAWQGQQEVMSTGTSKAFVGTAFADPQFLRIFHLPFLHGDALSALDRPRSIVLTREAAQRLFGSLDVVGRPLRMRNIDLTVTAVLDTLPGPSHIGPYAFSMSASLQCEALLSKDVADVLDGPKKSPGEDWDGENVITYMLLPPDGSIGVQTLNSELQRLARQHHSPRVAALELDARPISQLPLVTDVFALVFGLPFKPLMYTLGSFILCVACVNYANLAGALAIGRVREIGLRKVLGARRSQLIPQFLFESALHAAAALIVALLASSLLLPMLNRYLGFDLGAFLLHTPSFWTGLLIVLAAVSVLAGAYPAFVALRAMPASALRTSIAGARTGWGLKTLVSLQFALAGMLLVVVMVMNMQRIAFLELGPRNAADRIVVVRDLKRAGINVEAFRQQLRSSPRVTGYSASPDNPWSDVSLTWILLQRTQDPDEKPFNAMQRSGYYDYFETVGIRLLAGRTFSRTHGDSAPSAQSRLMVIDSTLAHHLGWTPQQAVGRPLYLSTAEKMAPPGQATIIGVVEDRPLAMTALNAGSFYVLSPGPEPGPSSANALIRVRRGDIRATLADIDAVWNRLAPDTPIQRQFLDDNFRSMQDNLRRIILALTAFVVCGLFIAISGLVGMAVHVVSRRNREIGIRKTLGSTNSAILRLLLFSFARPVIFGCVLGWPVAYLVAHALVLRSANPVTLTPLPFVLSLIIAGLIGALAVAAPAWRAARVNPADVLHYE